MESRSPGSIGLVSPRPPSTPEECVQPIAPPANVAAAVAVIRGRSALRPRIGLILGSGLGALADDLDDRTSIAFGDIPGMVPPTVAGHAGDVVLGRLSGRPVAVWRGRLHAYEGHSMAQVTYAVRVLAALGGAALIVTNAAGGLNPDWRAGDLMAISDHIFLPGLAGLNPLVGPGGGSERFVDMAQAYDPAFRKLARGCARRLDMSLREGVYAMVGGPSYETPAEQRLLRALGADAVGMSTAPEVVIARQLGLRVLGVSLITNMALAVPESGVNHADVLNQAARSADRFRVLIRSVVAAMDV